MTVETTNWWKKAEGDYLTMRREFTAPPNFDAVCFHAQQCIEKLLKACLIERNIRPPYTHHLPGLAEMLAPRNAELDTLWKDLELLSQYAVSVRYPIEFADRQEAKEAMDACARLRRILLPELGIQDLFE